MSKREECELTLSQWQQITIICASGRSNFPKKWGDKEVPIDEQLIGREDLGDLFKTLRSYSSWLQEIGDDYKLIFGAKSDWYPIDQAGERIPSVDASDKRIAGYKPEDPTKKYKIRLSREALSGVVWCCILKLHPNCIISTSTREAVDTWWPIAEAIGKTAAIRRYIGISGAKRSDWEDDPEPVNAEEKKA